MIPAYLNHFLAGLRFLYDFQRALHLITGKEDQNRAFPRKGGDQIKAVDQVKGGEGNETHEGQ
ncbi:MAG: hypothetical protein C0394_09855 [Syntrophus sp. (in: bacteria)]|nr:hypothetical protein [Syntrophus sp. (in: bacteria)]